MAVPALLHAPSTSCSGGVEDSEMYTEDPVTEPCPSCHRMFRSLRHTDTHEPCTERVNGLFHCRDCAYTTASIHSLVSHRSFQHLTKSFACTRCPYRAARHHDSINHFKRRHLISSLPFLCTQTSCTKSFATREELETHVAGHRKRRKATGTQRVDQSNTAVADVSTFLSAIIPPENPSPSDEIADPQAQLNMLLGLMSQCDVCQGYFLNDGQLNRHVRLHQEQDAQPIPPRVGQTAVDSENVNSMDASLIESEEDEMNWRDSSTQQSLGSAVDHVADMISMSQALVHVPQIIESILPPVHRESRHPLDASDETITGSQVAETDDLHDEEHVEQEAPEASALPCESMPLIQPKAEPVEAAEVEAQSNESMELETHERMPDQSPCPTTQPEGSDIQISQPENSVTKMTGSLTNAPTPEPQIEASPVAPESTSHLVEERMSFANDSNVSSSADTPSGCGCDHDESDEEISDKVAVVEPEACPFDPADNSLNEEEEEEEEDDEVTVMRVVGVSRPSQLPPVPVITIESDYDEDDERFMDESVNYTSDYL